MTHITHSTAHLKIKQISCAIATMLAFSQLAYANNITNNINTPEPIHWTCSANKNHQWICRKTHPKSTLSLFQKNLTQTEKTTALSNALGWVSTTSLNHTPNSKHSICTGHYYAPNLTAHSPSIPFTEAQSKITYAKATYKLKGKAIFKNVEITQPNRSLYAQNIILTPSKTTHQLNHILASGNVRLTQPGLMMIGNKGAAELTNHNAYFHNVYYLLKVRPSWDNLSNNILAERNFTGYARGHASSIQQTSKTQFVLHNTTYTTAPPTQNTWVLHAKKIKLNRKTGQGTAENTYLSIHNIPIFYLPYFKFPITRKRQSGFLFGNFSSSTNSGFSLSIPYYFNIAPNFDDTLTTEFYTKRGVLFNNNFRYLTHLASGHFNLAVIPHDIRTGHTRAGFSWQQNSQIGKNWTAKINYNYITDANFLKDFNSGQNAYTSNQVQLNRSIHFDYNNTHSEFSGLAQYYQVINPTLSAANQPYNRLPELNYSYTINSHHLPISVSFNAQLTHFQKNPFNASQTHFVDGTRLNLAPTFKLNIHPSEGFFEPALTLENRGYILTHTTGTDYSKKNIYSSIPEFSINSGLDFTRKFKFHQNQYTQTLEPRLFYAYTPYINQNNIPIFDTSIQNFSYQSLFQNNIYSGLDRISNADQLTLALQTQIQNTQGQQVFSAGIGQIHYFTHPRVFICSVGNSSCLSNSLNQLKIFDQSNSDIASFAKFNLSSHWNLSTNLLYNPHNSRLDSQSYQLQYIPQMGKVLNINYQYNNADYSLLSMQQLLNGTTPPSLSQLTTSAYWQLTPHWSFLGSWNYAFNSKHVINLFAGLGYDTCSWGFKFVIQRYISDSNPNQPSIISGPMQTAYVIQFQLKGLASTNASQINNLESEIPGFNSF